MQATINLTEQKQVEPVSATEEQGASTALAPLQEPIIEGEVTAIIEPELPPTPKKRPYSLLPLLTLLVCLLIVGVPHIWQFSTPSATVVIIPRLEHISTTGAIPIHGRLLPALTLSQSTTVPATGHRHQNATQAQGTITFYNGLFTSQTIGAGTILTGADGVEVITDEPAIIPAGNPPIYGEVTISAHAVDEGASGNIAALDVNTVCCATSVLAKNIEAFQGGIDAKDYGVVTHHDIDGAAGAIKTTLLKSERAALNAQLDPGEALITPVCTPSTTADHRIGEEATEVTVIVSDTCSSIAYPANALRQNATQLIQMDATRRLGTGYSLLGDMQVSIIHTIITDQGGIATILVKLDALYIYQINPGEKLHILQLIAGKSKKDAVKILFKFPGIQGATINSNAATLPDPGKIKLIIL